jgi:mycothiol S-conjugate amidase
VGLIRQHRPQVILTYNDDQRGYPHPDHLRVHDISVLAFDRAGDPMWYPEMGEPWQVSKMYYTLWAKQRIEVVHNALIEKFGESPFDENWLKRPSQDHRITTRVEIGKYLAARTQSLLAHATQIDPTSKWWFGLDDDELARVYPWEDWILARSSLDPLPQECIEDDVFMNIRSTSQGS